MGLVWCRLTPVSRTIASSLWMIPLLSCSSLFPCANSSNSWAKGIGSKSFEDEIFYHTLPQKFPLKWSRATAISCIALFIMDVGWLHYWNVLCIVKVELLTLTERLKMLSHGWEITRTRKMSAASSHIGDQINNSTEGRITTVIVCDVCNVASVYCVFVWHFGYRVEVRSGLG